MDSWAVLERRPNHVNKRVVADIWFWQFLEPWHERWYEYVIFIASCTDNIYDLENERWLLGDMIDHVGIYRSRVAEGLSASNVGLVRNCESLNKPFNYLAISLPSGAYKNDNMEFIVRNALIYDGKFNFTSCKLVLLYQIDAC